MQTSTLEAEHDIVIIGGGFIGMASAMWLQMSGRNVTILDNMHLSKGAYFGNAATIATYANIPVGTPDIFRQIPKLLLDKRSPLSIKWSYLPQLTPWLIAFLRSSTPSKVEYISDQLGKLLNQANDSLEPLISRSNSQNLLAMNGTLYLYGNERGFQQAGPNIQLRRKSGIDVQELAHDEIAELEPALNPIYHKGLLFNDGRHVRNPLKLLANMTDSFLRSGGRLLNYKALGFKRANATFLTINTDHEQIRCNKIVLSAGAWSRSLAAGFGDKVPLDTEQGYHVSFKGAQGLIQRPVGWADVGLYLTPLDTTLRAAGTVELGGLQNPINRKRIQLISRTAKKLLPTLVDHDSEWTGFRPSFPDSMPIIGPSPSDDHVFYAFGHGHIGLTLSGITGKLMSEMVNNQEPSIDITAFRADRF